MGLYRVIGDRVVAEAEVAEKRSLGAFRTLEQSVAKRDLGGSLKLRDGEIPLREMSRSGGLPPGSTTGNIPPTGLGKPCLVKFETVYTGKFGGEGGWFNSRKDMLVTSTMKSIHESSAQARAVNYLERDMGSRRLRHRPSPNLPGRPVIYYAPSLVSMNAAVKFEMAFDDVREEDFDKVSQVLQGIGQLPIFTPYNGFFWAAGVLVNLVKQIGKAIFDTSAEFAAEDTFDLTPIIGQPFAADLRFYMNDSDWRALEGKHRIKDGVLVDANDRQYTGDAPYMLISISGQEVKALDGFVPEAIGADVASRFFDSNRLSQVILDTVSKGVALYSDMQYWRDAMQFEAARVAALAKNPPDTDGAELAKTKRDAAVANIRNEDLLKVLPKFA